MAIASVLFDRFSCWNLFQFSDSIRISAPAIFAYRLRLRLTGHIRVFNAGRRSSNVFCQSVALPIESAIRQVNLRYVTNSPPTGHWSNEGTLFTIIIRRLLFLVAGNLLLLAAIWLVMKEGAHSVKCCYG